MIGFENINISEAHLGNIGLDSIWYGSIKVWPDGTPPTPTVYTFSVSPTSLTTDSSAKTVYFTVTTDSPQWVVSPSQSWITVNGITGDTVEIGIVANSTYLDRQGSLLFSYEKSSTGGTGNTTVEVIQQKGILPNNVIYYVSSGHSVITPSGYNFGANIVSNTYYPDDDYGEIIFDDNVTEIGDKTFFQRKNLSSIEIPDSATLIGYQTFAECTSLSSITIGSGVTSIGEGAFAYCTSLSSITMPNSVTSIGENAFNHCINLSSITIPDSVTTIEQMAFYWCTSLSSVTIGLGVTSIGAYTFYNCRSLSSIVFSGTMAQWTAITKGSNWKYKVPATVVHCTDGDVPI